MKACRGSKSVAHFLSETKLEVPTRTAVKKYDFDGVFEGGTTQQQIFQDCAKTIVECVIEGYNGTILAYGQTSSGKTHTMSGPDVTSKEHRGIIPRIVSHIFKEIMQADESIEFTVKVSMVEIYMEKIQDLLDRSKSNLKINDDAVRGIFIDGVTETYVTCENEVHNCIKIGNDNRSIAYTNMNAMSSRSHSIFILTIL